MLQERSACEVLKACQRHNIIAGIHVVEPNVEELIQRAADGYRLLAYSLDITMVMRASQEGLAKFRDRETAEPPRRTPKRDAP